MASVTANATPMAESVMLIKCVPIESGVQKRTIVIKLSAGQKIQVSSLAITLPAPSGRILHLRKVYPAAMQENSVSMGVKTAVNVVMVVPFGGVSLCRRSTADP